MQAAATQKYAQSSHPVQGMFCCDNEQEAYAYCSVVCFYLSMRHGWVTIASELRDIQA
jgi:hypothetical protein